MRQRKAKDLDKRMAECEHLMVRDPDPSKWSEYFGRQADTYVEIGCGKGNFIIKKALSNPQCNFIAIEGQQTVILRAMEKVRELQAQGKSIDNLRFMCTFVEDARDLFAEGSLAGIYLNFSDPWPKARHAKRRLTHHRRLKNYALVAKDGATVEFKTDNDDLFEFTMQQIQMMNLPVLEMSRNLHESDYESKYTMTEYEEKFSSRGKSINYVKVILK